MVLSQVPKDVLDLRVQRKEFRCAAVRAGATNYGVLQPLGGVNSTPSSKPESAINTNFLRFTKTVPSAPGIFLRNDGVLLNVSIEEHFDRSVTVHARDITPKWVPGKFQLPAATTIEEDRRLGESAPSFLGPIRIADAPLPTSLEQLRSNSTRPDEPGLFWMCRNLGHGWDFKLVAVSIHRFTTKGRWPSTDELFGFVLPVGEAVEVVADRHCIFTIALMAPDELVRVLRLPVEDSTASIQGAQVANVRCSACGVAPEGGGQTNRCWVCGAATGTPNGGIGAPASPEVPRH